jgi:hypothetical protein
MANGSRDAGAIPSQADWVSILAAVKRPINLLTLILLVTGVAVLAVAYGSESKGPEVLLIAVSFFAFVVLVVVGLAVWKPTALMGVEWLSRSLASSLAETMVKGLEGNVTNLPSSEDQIRAWVDLIIWIEWYQQEEQDTTEREFRASLVRGIQFRVLTQSPYLKPGIEAGLRERRAS